MISCMTDYITEQNALYIYDDIREYDELNYGLQTMVVHL